MYRTKLYLIIPITQHIMATTGNGIATTYDLVLKLRDRGFSMYTEQQMDEQ